MSYFGKYRAVVTDLNDPDESGRVKVACPDLFGESSSLWCTPCFPAANDEFGDFYLPKEGEAVFIEFEEGSIHKPVIVGGWYSPGKTPVKDYSKAKTQRVIGYGKSSQVFEESEDGNTRSLTTKVGEKNITTSKEADGVSSVTQKIGDNAEYTYGEDGMSVEVEGTSFGVNANGLDATVDGSSLKVSPAGTSITAGGSNLDLNPSMISKISNFNYDYFQSISGGGGGGGGGGTFTPAPEVPANACYFFVQEED